MTCDFTDLIGKPYERFARGPAAYDCYGLVQECLRRSGLPVPPDYTEVDPFDAEQCNAAMFWELESEFDRVDDPKPGDVVMMNFRDGGLVRSHPGFMDSASTFLTTTGKTGAIRIDFSDRFWSKHIVGFYRAQ